MPKKIIYTMLIAGLVLAGCNLIPVAPTAAPVATDVVPPAATQTPIIIVVTATPEAQQAQPTDTAVPAATNTASPSDSINITRAEDLGGGKANVTWEVNGNFPAGFEVVWSESNSSPSFPGDSSTYLSDPATRAVQIVGQPGHTYYLRICRYVNNSCDLYSNVAQIKFSGAPATPIVVYPTSIYPTATSKPALPAYNGDGDLISADAGMKITKVVKTDSGKATLYFQAIGSFPKGFKLIQTTANRLPTYGMYPDVSVPSGNRTVEVTGTVGKTYFFRLCRYNGSTCDVYSPTFEFLFTSFDPTATVTQPAAITITSITDTAPGQARIFWTATGTINKGFRIVYSTTDTTPDFPADDYYSITSSSTRSAYINGLQGYTYYYRICRFTGSSCDEYSPVYTFKYAGTKLTMTPTPTRTPTTVPPTATTVPPTATATATATTVPPTATATTVPPSATPTETPTETATTAP
jgi:hypothetical protein